MIELTDEQKELLFNEHLSFAENVVPHKKALAHLVSNIGNLLTTAQIQQLCKQHGGSFVQWHEFDVHDYDSKTVLSQNGIVFEKGDLYTNIDYKHDGVTHWCELPTPPKEK